MRTIERPPHFTHQGAIYTFEEFITAMVARGTIFARDFKGLSAASRIVKAPLYLQEDDWRLLCAVVQNPNGGYPIPLPHRLVPYIDAVLNARDLEAESELRAALAAEEAARLQAAEEADLGQVLEANASLESGSMGSDTGMQGCQTDLSSEPKSEDS